MNKIKVLHCFGGLNIGGAETLILNIFRNIDRSKFQFDFLVFTNEKGVYEDEILKLGGKIHRVKSLRETNIIEYMYQIQNIIKNQGGYDIIHSHMDWLGGFITLSACLGKVPIKIVHSHAIQDIFEDSTIKKFIIFISKLLIRVFANANMACSIDAAESLFYKNKNVYIIKNGIDLKKFSEISNEDKIALRTKYNISKDDILLGSIGSMSINKNHIFLLEIMKELIKQNKRYKLMLVGNGSEEQSLRTYVDNNNMQSNVIFIDKSFEINTYLSIMDIFLFPSIREGFGMVAIEAQAKGLPCIVSNTIPKEIDVGGDLLKRIPINDKNKWIECILNTETKEKRDTNIMKNLIREKEYDIESSTYNLEHIYKDLYSNIKRSR